MSNSYRQDLQHQPRGMVRRVCGWLVVVAGVAMLVLPGPGLLALVLGIILLGRREPMLRRVAVLLRLHLRRLSRAKQPLVRRVGHWLWGHYSRARHFVREQLHRHANGQPLNVWIQVWIVVTIVSALAGVGLGLLVLLG